jgi:NO-binding membrane sensor protein with MHYT domain
LFLLCAAGGGVWLALHLVDMLAMQAGNGVEFHLSREGVPLLIPVGMAGAMVGAFVGGMLFPARR